MAGCGPPAEAHALTIQNNPRAATGARNPFDIGSTSTIMIMRIILN